MSYTQDLAVSLPLTDLTAVGGVLYRVGAHTFEEEKKRKENQKPMVL